MSNRPDIVEALEQQEKRVDRIIALDEERKVLMEEYRRFNIYDYVGNSRETRADGDDG